MDVRIRQGVREIIHRHREVERVRRDIVEQGGRAGRRRAGGRGFLGAGDRGVELDDLGEANAGKGGQHDREKQATGHLGFHWEYDSELS